MKRFVAFFFTVALTFAAAAQGLWSNPVIDGWYADPDGFVDGNTLWVFPTRSLAFDKQTYFDAFSTEDMVYWKKHPNILSTEQVKWASRALWAPSIVKKDGTYYLFFSANDVHEGEVGGIGVACAKRPEGPYKDLLGKPLIPNIVNGAHPIDQFVFQDPKSGNWYMYYGGWKHCNAVRLAKDFKSLIPFDDGEFVKEVTPQDYVEGPFMLYNYRFAPTSPQGKLEAVFAPANLEKGKYEVQIMYSASGNRVKAADVTVSDKKGNHACPVDMTVRPKVEGLWHSLGVYVNDPKKPLKVIFTNIE